MRRFLSECSSCRLTLCHRERVPDFCVHLLFLLDWNSRCLDDESRPGHPGRHRLVIQQHTSFHAKCLWSILCPPISSLLFFPSSPENICFIVSLTFVNYTCTHCTNRDRRTNTHTLCVKYWQISFASGSVKSMGIESETRDNERSNPKSDLLSICHRSKSNERRE